MEVNYDWTGTHRQIVNLIFHLCVLQNEFLVIENNTLYYYLLSAYLSDVSSVRLTLRNTGR